MVSPHRRSLRRVLRSTALALVASLATPIAAQQGLYTDAVERDAALVRVFFAAPGTIDLGIVRFSSQEGGVLTPYRAVAPDVYVIGGRGGALVEPQPGSYATVIFGAGRPHVHADPPHRDALRTQILVYNAASSPVAVAARPLGSTADPLPLVDEVPAGGARERLINAVALELFVRPSREPLTLSPERGDSWALIIGDGFTHVAPASVSP